MKRFGLFLRRYTLFISMLLGVVGFRWFRLAAPALPTLIFLMLFFTFCKINPLDLRLHRWHWIVLSLQIVFAVSSYYIIRLIDDTLAQGIMLCFIMPTATAGPIIAGKLGGSIQSLTSFTLLSNIATAIIVPLLFPIVNPAANMTFIVASLTILRRVAPLLLAPFLLAWLVRIVSNAIMRKKDDTYEFHLNHRWSGVSFYIWACTLVILMAQITWTLIYDQYDPWMAIGQAIGALLTCIIQFYLGKHIGQHFPNEPHGKDYFDDALQQIDLNDYAAQTKISAGQAFGQKNTTLAMWMAQTYLNPLSSIAAAAYIIWQNMFNAWQLSHATTKNNQPPK